MRLATPLVPVVIALGSLTATQLAGCTLFGCTEQGCPELDANFSLQRADAAPLQADTVLVNVDGQTSTCSIPEEDSTAVCGHGMIFVRRGHAERCYSEPDAEVCDGSGPPDVHINVTVGVAVAVTFTFQRDGETTEVRTLTPRYDEIEGACLDCAEWEETVIVDA